ncbi:MAG: recombinase family protein [Candidatus Thermoplasmatota archaeon]|nr:recombinase family protein [Candidatus Thermoplasmatota archaeon]
MKVALYMRCSTEKQADAKSISLQEDTLKKYCDYAKYKIAEKYVDEAKSGKDVAERPAFQKLMRDAESKKFDAVAVAKLDRFGRSVKDLVNSIDKLKNLGIDFISVGDNINTTTPNGRLLFHILSAFAEFEREIIKERMLLGKEKARAEGKTLHRPRKELPLEEIKKLYVDKKLSLCAIGKFYKVHPATIGDRLREMGVEIRKL